MFASFKVISCGDPGMSINANRSNSSWLYGDMIVYRCDFGYKRTSGNLERTCKGNGQWNGTLPMCTGNMNHFQRN